MNLVKMKKTFQRADFFCNFPRFSVSPNDDGFCRMTQSVRAQITNQQKWVSFNSCVPIKFTFFREKLRLSVLKRRFGFFRHVS